MSESTGQSPSDEESRIEQLVDEFVRARRSGDSVSRNDIVVANPELEPDLSRRLVFAESLVEAIQKAESEETTRLPAPRVSERLRCPHCGNIVQLVDDSDEITCGSCGSSIEREEGATQLYSPSSTRIAHFDLIERVGRGGFGVVYRARDTRLNRDVALKIPRRGYFGTADEEERFLREARSAANIKHPNVVQVHEIGSENGLHYIATEFIDGQNLADLVKGQLLDFRRTATLLAKIGAALHHAHEQKVIHRDVKPANILVDANDQPFLTDFGLARKSEPAITVTRDGEVLGTPAYMSPEQAAAEHHRLDRRSDIYSLGVTLFRMLSGELPFRGSRRMLLNKVLHDDPPMIRSLNESVPRDLETIALRAMEKVPEKRYQTALAFGEELQRWLAGDPILSRPISSIERAWRWCRKRPLITSLLATIALLLFSISIGSVVWGFREKRLKQVAEASDIESRERLSSALAYSAAEKLNDGDNFGSLPYAVEALGVQRTLDSESATLTRIQLGATLANSPRLLHLQDIGESVGEIVRRPDGQGFVVASGTTIRRYNTNWRRVSPDLSSQHVARRVVFSNDSARILAFDTDHADKGGATLWTSADGVQAARINHPGLTDAAFSPDGTLVASGGGETEANIRVWSATDGSLQSTFMPDGAGMLNLQFSPDGERLAGLSYTPGEQFKADYWLSVWTLATEEQVKVRIAEDEFLRFTFLADGRLLTVSESGSFRRYDARGQVDQQFQLNGGSPATFSSTTHNLGPVLLLNENSVLTRANDAVRIWDLSSPQLRLGPIGHGGPIGIHGLTLSPDGTMFATAGEHARVNVFRTATGERVGPAIGHGASVWSAEFLSDTVLATGTTNGVLKIWDLSGITRGSTVLKLEDRVTDAQFSPDSKRVATTCEDQSVTLWSRESGEQIRQVRHDSAAVLSAFSPDGKTLVSGDTTGGLLVHDVVGAGNKPESLEGSARITEIRFSTADSDVFATADDKGDVRIWRRDQSAPIQSVQHSNMVRAMHFDLSGQFLASCSHDRTARIWNLKTGRQEGPSLSDDGPVSWCQFSPDGRLLGTSGLSGNIILWDWKTGTAVTTLAMPERQETFDFSPDGVEICSASGSGFVHVWDTRVESQPRWSFSHPSVNSVDWHPTRSLIVAAGDRNGDLDRPHLRIWNASSGLPLSPKLPHASVVWAAEFSPDGTAILSHGEDQTARIWSIEPTAYDLETLRLLSIVMNGSAMKERRLVPVSASVQTNAFTQLRERIPGEFISSESERKRFSSLHALRKSQP